MAKITRYNGNLLSFGVNSTGVNRTVFGDTTQSDALDDNINADYLLGWEIVEVNEAPTKQDFNALGYTLGQLLAYLHQVGVAEWDAAQEYHTPSVTNRSGVLYISQTNDNTGNDPATDDGTNWLALPASSVSYDNTTSGLTAEDVKAALDELTLRTGSGETLVTVTPSSDADHPLTQSEYEADILVLNLTNWTIDRQIIAPDEVRAWDVFNTSGTRNADFITATGSDTLTVPAGTSRPVVTDGSEVVDPLSAIGPMAVSGAKSFDGKIEKGTGDTITIPEGGVNIGGNGRGNIILSATDLDPLANDDGTITSLSIGDNVYIYAVYSSSRVADIVFSYNDDIPSGYTATNSRKIGGFHVGKVRDIADAYDSAATLSTGIIPNSVWDLLHRPTCDPTGMVEIIPGQVWIDIYLASEVSGTWPDNLIGSVYNAVPLTGTEGYNRYYDYIRLARNVGKRLPYYPEMIAAAYGVPEGATGNTARQNTGDHSGYGFEAVSCLNMDQPAGNVYQTLLELYDRSTGTGWKDDLNTGKDSAEQHGQWYGGEMRNALFGGYWADAAGAGSRSVYLVNAPWNVATNTGLRAACDALKIGDS